MGIFGHLGVGLVAKRFTPHVPLWVLLFSTLLIDIPAMIFMSAPLWLTHGLFMAIILSVIASVVAALIIKYLNSKQEANTKLYSPISIFNTSMVIGLLVFSHWVLDLIGWSMTGIGIPLLFDDSQLITLDIQINLVIGLLLIEIGPFISGLVVYLHYMKMLKKEKKMK